jgi:phosphopantothenoylcysteine decarboxylase/phosphopantothenate--cysteine ligase
LHPRRAAGVINPNRYSMTILLGVSGSIAAYKACEITRALIKRGASVHVLMTEHATAFVTPMTFQTLSRNPVTVGLFDQIEDWKPEHISLAERAQALVIAPATANVLAKLAHGLADDALSSTALAFAGPVIVAPAMNTGMYQHPATQANLQTLRARGVVIVEPDAGALACGTVGVGRMAAPDEIVAAVVRVAGVAPAAQA